jgi:hypothetical protein
VSRVSLAAITGAGPGAAPLTGTPVCGLLLDEWPEQIPNSVESTALVFHYDEPAARAPQALLLATNPAQSPWSYELLGLILMETLDLAKIRTVDLSSLTGGGQVLPALYAAFNPQGDTISTTLGNLQPHAGPPQNP